MSFHRSADLRPFSLIALLSAVPTESGNKANAPLLYLRFSLKMENRLWFVFMSFCFYPTTWHIVYRNGL